MFADSLNLRGQAVVTIIMGQQPAFPTIYVPMCSNACTPIARHIPFINYGLGYSQCISSALPKFQKTCASSGQAEADIAGIGV